MMRGNSLVDEHFPLLEPFGISRQDILAIVDECNHDREAVAEKVARVVNSKIHGQDDNILWHSRNTPQTKRKQIYKRKDFNRKTNKNDRHNKSKPENPGGEEPEGRQQNSPALKEVSAGITHVSKPKTTKEVIEKKPAIQPTEKRVAGGKTWADRVKGDHSLPTTINDTQQEIPEVVQVERSTTVFSWVAAAQGRRVQKGDDSADLPPATEEVEEHQPVPDRVFSIHHPLKAGAPAPSPAVPEFEELPPPAGFETLNFQSEEPRRPYRQIVGHPTIKQRETPLPPARETPLPPARETPLPPAREAPREVSREVSRELPLLQARDAARAHPLDAARAHPLDAARPHPPKPFSEAAQSTYAPRPPMGFEQRVPPMSYPPREYMREIPPQAYQEYGYHAVDPYSYLEMHKAYPPYPFMHQQSTESGQKQTDEGAEYAPMMQPPAYYDYERDYFMKARQMAAENRYNPQRPPRQFGTYRGAPMPPMFAAAAGRSEMAMVGATSETEVPFGMMHPHNYYPPRGYPSYAQSYGQAWRQ